MIFISWLVNALALILVAYLLPGFTFSGFYSALVTVVVLGLINAVIRPLVLLLTLPVNLLTLGLLTFVINALMLWITSTVVKGFTIDNFTTAIIAALILWAISFLSNWLVNVASRPRSGG